MNRRSAVERSATPRTWRALTLGAGPMAGLALSLMLARVPLTAGGAEEQAPPLPTARVTARPLKPVPPGKEIVEYLPGEPILVEWTVTNEGPGEGRFLSMGHGVAALWTVTTIAGGRAWPEATGGADVESPGPVPDSSYKRLSPGRSWRKVVDLTMKYSFPPRGEYEVDMRYCGKHPKSPADAPLGASAYHQPPPFPIRLVEPPASETRWRFPYMALELAKHEAREWSGHYEWRETARFIRNHVIHGRKSYLQQWGYYYQAVLAEKGSLIESETPKQEVLALWRMYLDEFPNSICAFVARERLGIPEPEDEAR